MDALLELLTYLINCFERGDVEVPENLRKNIEACVERVAKCYPGIEITMPIISKLVENVSAVGKGPNPDEDYDKIAEKFAMTVWKKLSGRNNARTGVVLEALFEYLALSDDLFMVAEKVAARRSGSTTVTITVSDAEEFAQRLGFSIKELENGARINHT